jgi:hypothetical protein
MEVPLQMDCLVAIIAQINKTSKAGTGQAA